MIQQNPATLSLDRQGDVLTVRLNRPGRRRDLAERSPAPPACKPGSLFKRAISGWVRTLGKDNNNTLTAITLLGVLYANQARYAEAELNFKRASEAQERTLGKDNFSTLLTLKNLADLYQNLARFSEAEPILKRLVEAGSRTLGKDAAWTLNFKLGLAVLY